MSFGHNILRTPTGTATNSGFNSRLGLTQARNRRIVRYLLCRIEKQTDGREYDFESDAFGLEHVLPLHPGAGWEAFTDEEIETLASRLGNLTLLETASNRELGNADYAAKRPVYAASGFALTRKLAEESADWTPERIAARQNWMARQSVSLWRIAQLSER